MLIAKMINILCFEFVILFIVLNMCMFTYVQNNIFGNNFRVNIH